MKIQLIIGSDDVDYLEHLSRVLAGRYADTFEVNTCSLPEKLGEIAQRGRFDVALLSPSMLEHAPTQMARLTLVLWEDGQGTALPGQILLRKYQRISSLVGDILQQYAQVSSQALGLTAEDVVVTAVWSPSGGSGKTTVALAYAAQKVSENKKTVYFDLEPFSSTPVYFPTSGKSLSTVFEQLDCNVELLLQSIRQKDDASGIFYFCRPDNYDDIRTLSAEDLMTLVDAGSKGVQELVLDLGSGYDLKTRALLERADQVLLVSEPSRTSQGKLEQFCAQNDLYERIKEKTVLVLNRARGSGAVRDRQVVVLPPVQSEDPVVVYKTLSGGYFHL